MKVNGKKVRKFKGGGADMGDPARAQERADRGYGSTAAVDRSAVGEGSKYAQNVAAQTNQQTNQVTTPKAKRGPLQVPTIGPLSYAFNKISKGLYDKKNLKEARKDDILGGEMLTTGSVQTKSASLDRGGDGPRQLCPDGTYPPCKTPATQIKAPVTEPNKFLSGFQSYDDGGEVVISSNVDKSLL